MPLYQRGPSSIQYRLVLLLFAVLLPILLVQTSTYYDRFRSQHAQELQANLEIARTLAETFDRFVQDILHQELAIGTALTLAPSLSPQQLARLIDLGKAQYPAILDMGWISPQGRVVFSSQRHTVGLDISDRSYFREISAGKEWVVSDLLLSLIAAQPIFTISRGVRDAKGTLQGIVVSVILPDRLREILAIERAGEGAIAILDSKGRAVYRYPEIEWTWEQRGLLNTYPVIGDTLEGREITTTVSESLDGTRRMIALTPIPSLGWVAGASRPEKMVMEPILYGLIRHAGLFLFVTVAAFLFALIVSRTIAHPVERLRDHAQKLGRGELMHRVEVDGPVELRELAHALNRMAEEILIREKRIGQERRQVETLAAEMQALAQERARHLTRLNTLIQVSTEVLSETTMEGLLRRIVGAARRVTEAGIGISGHAYKEGRFQLGISPESEEVPLCAVEELNVEKGGVYLDLIEKTSSIRLTDRQMRDHPAWWGLPEGHTPLRGLLGARLVDRNGEPEGIILLSDKKSGDFTAEDEAMLNQLAGLASLGLQHIRAGKDAEQRAEEAEEGRRILDALMEYMPEGITIVDASGMIVRMMSRYGSELAGYPREALEGIPLAVHVEKWGVFRADGVTPASYEEFPLSRAVLRAEVVTDEELVLQRPDGKKISILCNAGPIRDQEGRIIGGVIAWRDIGVLKAVQEALRKAHDELEIRVHERTAELQRANENLKVYATRLEWSNRELQDLAFIASHDLQEPLRKIQAFGSRVKVKYSFLLDDRGKDYLERMQNAAKRMQELIQALLSYSRITSRMEPFTVVHLRGLIRNVLNTLAPSIEQTDAQVEVGEDLPDLEADENQMRQLFLQLIGNALKFRGKEKPVIRIYGRCPDEQEAKTMKPGEARYRIYVEDNGIGFDEKYLNRIFTPFQRLHGQESYEGTGMGLAICRRIVERHGGSITARSIPGKGSTFIITLPVKQSKRLVC